MARAGGAARAGSSVFSSRHRILAAGVVVLLAVVGVLLSRHARGDSTVGSDPSVVATSDSDDTAGPSDGTIDDATESTPPEPTSPLAVDPPREGPIDDVETEQARVAEAVELVVEATNQIAQRGDGVVGGLESIATGFVLGELENLAREQAEQGYKQSGEARVVSAELLSSDLDADVPHIVLGVCIDVSEVTVTDANGTDVSDRLYDPGHPVRHEYGADFIDDVWMITTHEIPAVQNCASEES